MPKGIKTISLQYLCNILRKNGKDKLDVLPADGYQRFRQIAIIVLDVCDQITQNNKFSISL